MNVELFKKRGSEFQETLADFYRRKWNCSLRVPNLGNGELDLFTLYRKVASLGGWLKVSNSHKWGDVLEAMGLPTDCAVIEHGVRILYMRHLAKYESDQLFAVNSSDEEDMVVGSGYRGGSSYRGTSTSMGSSVRSAKQSSALYTTGPPRFKKTHVYGDSRGASLALQLPFARLIRSLECGLSNEINFALNLCLHQSGTSPKTIDLNRFPKLIDVLLAHAGIFEPGSKLRDLYENWKKLNKKLFLVQFWHDALMGSSNADVKALLGKADRETGGCEYAGFNLSRNSDSKDVVKQRIYQVCSILRNLSFEHGYRSVMAASKVLQTFILVAMESEHSWTKGIAMDILSNIATHLELEPLESESTQFLFRALSKSLFSDDKFCIMRAVETLGNLSLVCENEPILREYLDVMIVRRLLSLLSIKDILLCLYLLECFYQLSHLSKSTLQHFLKLKTGPKCIGALVTMLTIEAVSFGRNGLSCMKVVEYNLLPGSSGSGPSYPGPSVGPPTSTPRRNPPGGGTFATPHQPPPQRASTSSASGSAGATMPAPRQVPGQLLKNHRPKLEARGAFAPYPAKGQTTTPQANPSVKISTGPLAGGGKPSLNNSGPSVAPDPMRAAAAAEKTAAEWLKQHCAVDSKSSVSESELYTHYAEFVTNQGKRSTNDVQAALILANTTFSNLIRKLYPSVSFRKLADKANSSTSTKIEGIRYLVKPKSEPGLRTEDGNLTTSGIKGDNRPITAQHPTMQRILNAASPSFGSPHSPQLPRSKNAPTPVASPYTPAESQKSPSGSSGQPLVNGDHKPPAALLRSQRRKKAEELGMRNPPPTNCKVEICGVAQTANQILAEQSTKHETCILRVENTLVGKAPAGPTPKGPVPTIGTQPVHNSPKRTPEQSVLDPPVLPNGPKVNGEVDQEDSFDEPPPPSKKAKKAGPINGLIGVAAAAAARKVGGGVLGAPGTDPHIKFVEQVMDWTPSPDTPGAGNEGSDPDFPENPPKPPGPPTATKSHQNHEAALSSEKANQSTATEIVEAVIAQAREGTMGVKSEPLETSRSPDRPKLPGPNGHDALKVDPNCPPPTGAPTINGQPSGGAPSPSPDSMQNNLDMCQASIQQILNSVASAKIGPPLSPQGSTTSGEGRATPTTNASGGTPGTGAKRKRGGPGKRPATAGKDGKAPASPSSVTSVNRKLDPGGGKPTGPLVSKSEPGTIVRNAQSTSQAQVQRHVLTKNLIVGKKTILRPFTIPPPKPDDLLCMCEWDNCGRTFHRPGDVFSHVFFTHVPKEPCAIPCLWTHCNREPRLRLSLLTHIQDTHCNASVQKLAATRRYELSKCSHSNIPEPKVPQPHPGYAVDAALNAIRRHHSTFTHRDFTEENEGPVTKSLRLTACLTLRNFARYAEEGKRLLKPYESHLVHLAFSKMENSTALAQCLFEITSSLEQQQEQDEVLGTPPKPPLLP